MLYRKWLRMNSQSTTEQPDTTQQNPLSTDLNENLSVLRSIYADCSDVVYRPFLIGGNKNAVLIHIDGLSNMEEIDRSVLAPLIQETESGSGNLKGIYEKISVTKIKEVKSYADCVEQISMGNPVLLVDQENQGLSAGLSKWEKRGVEEPVAEAVLRGPREGFTETLAVNTALLRRKIRTPELKMQSKQIGRRTRTEVVISYMEGIADKTLIEEVKNRLQRIDIDGVV